MQATAPSLPVLLCGDDPHELHQLARAFAEAGLTVHAVAEMRALARELVGLRRTPAAPCAVIVAVRDVASAVLAREALSAVPPQLPFVAVVDGAQLPLAQRQATAMGWAGVAVRPVDAAAVAGLLRQLVPARRPTVAAPRLGSLDRESVLDVLAELTTSTAVAGGKTAVVRVESRGRHGLIALADGQLVHAAIDGEQGRHCLERMAAWRDGVFSIEPLAWPGEPSLNGTTPALLAVAREYVRRLEEAVLGLPALEAAYAVRWERVRPLPVVAEALFRRVAAGLPLREALAGEGDDELEALAALEMRIRRGAVVAEGALASVPPTDRMAASRPTPAGGTARPAVAWQASAMTEGEPANLPPRDHGRPQTNEYAAASVAAPSAAVPHSDTAVAVGAEPPSTPPAGPVVGLSMQGVNAAAMSDWFGTADDEAPASDGRRDQLLAGLQASARASSHAIAVALETSPLGESATDDAAAEEPSAPAEAAAEVGADQSDVATLTEPSRSRSWARWTLAAAAVVAIAVAGGWWWRGRAAAEPAAVQAYRQAVALWDAGDAQAAREAFRAIDTQAVPEAALHLAVLDVRAQRFAEARASLARYLQDPHAAHRAEAQRLYRQVFGAAAPGASP